MVTKSPVVTMERVRNGRPIRMPATRSPARRGRIAATSVAALVIGALSVGLATAAQAAHSGAGPGRGYVAQVEVRPGQSLWSIAEAYDPDADPRVTVHDIQQLNSMSGDQVQAGEVLWVPRG